MARLLSLATASRTWFIIFLLFLPTQLGYHWWPEFTKVYGFRLDYLSPTLYLTDLLLTAMVVTFFFHKTNRTSFTNALQTLLLKHRLVSASFLVFVLLNCFYAPIPLNALLKWLQILKLTILIWYITQQPFLKLHHLTPLLRIIILYISLIGIAQFITQSSLDGIFWLLGERTHTFSTPGIAKAVLNGHQVLRSYSIFSHPNSFAGFLLVCLILLLHQPVTSLKQPHSSKILSILTVILGLIALGLTFSRLALLALVVVVIVKISSKISSITPANILPPVFFASLLFPFLLLLFPALADQFPFLSRIMRETSVQQRLLQYQQLPFLIKDNFLLGIGNNNYLPYLQTAKIVFPSWSQLQPIHNVWWLIFVEIGLIGSLFLFKVIIKFYNKIKKVPFQYQSTPLLALLAIFITAAADHYWWTLHQNQLLLAVVLGYLLNSLKSALPSNSKKETAINS